MPIHAHFSATDFDPQSRSHWPMRSAFISRSVHARLYKSLCAAVTICASLANSLQMHTQRQTHTQTPFSPPCMNSSVEPKYLIRVPATHLQTSEGIRPCLGHHWHRSLWSKKDAVREISHSVCSTREKTAGADRSRFRMLNAALTTTLIWGLGRTTWSGSGLLIYLVCSPSSNLSRLARAIQFGGDSLGVWRWCRSICAANRTHPTTEAHCGRTVCNSSDEMDGGPVAGTRVRVVGVTTSSRPLRWVNANQRGTTICKQSANFVGGGAAAVRPYCVDSNPSSREFGDQSADSSI